ncbi:hypothetical protein [Pseudoleptotrichia goodfellowii]|uniref:Phage protein Gp138 N-terminal domain-containing protein n=1 Tax=Pseudoleptotrichia goodfellowii TaxID=157692 RepID=A0A510JBG7_9FUSO|nr:hypothetical protein [Pseudoleptotrichia goodfellowii]BBM35463.1 hypothetical protein JCM16774_0376 [Pseudoleptotrichia goodfellowii]
MAFSELEKHNRTIVTEELNDIHTLWIAKIYDVNNEERKASVKFLQKAIRTLKNDYFQTPPEDLIDVPLLPVFSSQNFEIYIPYSNGDKVLVGVLERPYIEAFYNDEVQEQQSFGRMDMGYSVVLKAIPKSILSDRQNNSKNILIRNNETNIIIKNGTIEVNGNCTWNGNLKFNGDVTINGKLKVKSVETDDIKTENGISKDGTPYIHP